MADQTGILELLIKLGVVGQDDVKAAKGLLDEYKESASKLEEEMGAHTVTQKEVGEAIGDTGEIAKKAGGHFGEMHSMMRGLNQIVPGLGYLFRIAFSPVTGIVLGLGFAFQAARHALNEWNTEMDAAADRASKPLGAGIENLKTSWDSARESLGKYLAAAEAAGTDKDPTSTMIKRVKELDDARIEGIKKVIEATGKLEEATIRANEAGQDPAKIEADVKAAQARTTARISEIEGKKTVADLEREQEVREIEAQKLSEASAAAVEPARRADQKAKTDAETLKNLREANAVGAKAGGSAVGLTTSGDLDKMLELKKDMDDFRSGALFKTSLENQSRAVANIDFSGMNAGQVNDEIQKRSDSMKRQRDLQAKLESSEVETTEAKTKADTDLANSRAAETKNKERLGALPEEIKQAQALAGIQGFTASDTAAVLKKTQAAEDVAAREKAGQTKTGMIEAGATAQNEMAEFLKKGYTPGRIESEEQQALKDKALGHETDTDKAAEDRYSKNKADTEVVRVMMEVLSTYEDQGESMLRIMAYHQAHQTAVTAEFKQIEVQAALNAAQIEHMAATGSR